MTRRAEVTWSADGEPARILFADVAAVFRLWLRGLFLAADQRLAAFDDEIRERDV